MQLNKQQLEPDMEHVMGTKLGKEYSNAVYCHLAYLTYMQSTSCKIHIQCLDESQAGVKIDRRNINNLRYGNDTTLIAESEEELKSFLMSTKEESEKIDLKLNIQKMKILTSGPISSRQIDGKTMETVTDFIFLGSKTTVDSDCSREIKKTLAP